MTRTATPLLAGTAAEISSGVALVFPGQGSQRPEMAEPWRETEAFALWAHADDIRRACGWPPSSPPPADLRTMSSFSVQSLPLLLGVVAPAVAMAPARVVLTGPGGATFDLGGYGPRAVTLVADVLDYCRLATRRVGRDEAGVVCEGDQRLGDGLLAAAQVFAI